MGRLAAGAAWGAGPAGGVWAARDRPRRYNPECPRLPTARVDWSMGQINLHSSPWNVKHVCHTEKLEGEGGDVHDP